MRGFVLVLTIITGLLIFGCLGPTAPETQAPAGGAPTQPAQPPPTQPGGETPPAQPPAEQPPAEEPGEQPTDGGFDLAGLTYLELAALGVPIECDITTTYQGTVQSAKMYIAGEDKVRYESAYDGEQMVVIVLGDVTYMTNFLASQYPDCLWIKMLPEDTEPTEPTGGYTYETAPDFEEMPATDFECRPWAYDDSKFAIPTQKVCTMDEFTDLIMSGYDIPDYG